ncbi:MAG: hypothetical protein ACREGA_02225 [Candidatus Saccharimonadales bacterium]
MKKAYQKTISVLGSRLFFWLVVVLFALQALWVAFSFRYPLPYDEGYHFGLIKIFSHHLYSPIIANQPHAYDAYRDLFHGGSHLYHYIMAFPYQLISAFTGDQVKQILALRVINIALFASGLYLFSRLFRKIGIKRIYINIALLFLVLLPMTSEVAATINYDNMLFPLTAIFLIYCVRIVMVKSLNWRDYAGVIIFGCFASLVQFEFLPIFAAAVIYLIVLAWRGYGKSFFAKLKQSIKKSKKLSLAAAAVLLIIFVGLFSQVYIADTVKYGTPQPSCAKTLGQKRCDKDVAVIGIYNRLAATKNQRPVVALPNYFLTWSEDMESYTGWSAAVQTNGALTTSGPLPIVYFMLFAFTIGGLAILLYAWRSISKNRSYYFLATIAFFLVLVEFLVNMMSNYKYNQPVAIQARYLLPVLPIIMVFIVLAFNSAMRRIRYLKLGFLAVVFVVFILGGAGLSTHILLSQDNWYWQGPKVIKANHAAKKVLAPVIKQGYTKYGV